MHIAIFRFSSLGDVAMTVPVVASLAETYPKLRITMVSQPQYQPLFAQLPSNVFFFGADIKDKYDGVTGLSHLHNDLKELKIDAIVDFHDVLRTKYLKLLFRLDGTPIETIEKGRIDKYRLTAHHTTVAFHQLKHSTERYADVLRKMRLPIRVHFTSIFNFNVPDYTRLNRLIGKKTSLQKWIGIAPLAAHQGKIYPLEKMKEVINILYKHDAPNIRFFVFGSSREKDTIKQTWGETSNKVEFASDYLSGLAEELLLINQLDVMISMDSANMHLASLTQTRVVSIWGATHPYAGFLGFGQNKTDVIQAELPCRPCSIYGNKPCSFGDYRCMYSITPQQIANKIINP